MMGFVRDVIANVVQQRCRRKQGPMMTSEAGSSVVRRQLIEYPFRQPRYLPRVPFLITETPAHCMHATQAVIDDVRNWWARLSFYLSQAIDQNAFAQRPSTRA